MIDDKGFHEDEKFCVTCGTELPKARQKMIERLRLSSAHVFARGECDECWDKRHGGKEVKTRGPKGSRPKARPGW